MQGRRERVKAALLERGYSVSGWARQRSFSPDYVIQILNRYAEKSPDRMTHSAKVWRVLKALKTDTGINLMEKEG